MKKLILGVAIIVVAASCSQKVYPVNYNTTNGIKNCNYPYPYKWKRPQ